MNYSVETTKIEQPETSRLPMNANLQNYPRSAKILLFAFAALIAFGAEFISSIAQGAESAKMGAYRGMSGRSIGPAKEKTPKFEGYLAMQAPTIMRFSDEVATRKRPPSPALPEFTVIAPDYAPYMIETPIAESDLPGENWEGDLVVELEPHVVVSGAIDTSAYHEEKVVDRLELETDRAAIIRPEEVLIYFDNVNKVPSGQEGEDDVKANILVPFSPAKPSAETIKKSSATYQKIR